MHTTALLVHSSTAAPSLCHSFSQMVPCRGRHHHLMTFQHSIYCRNAYRVDTLIDAIVLEGCTLDLAQCNSTNGYHHVADLSLMCKNCSSASSTRQSSRPTPWNSQIDNISVMHCLVLYCVPHAILTARVLDMHWLLFWLLLTSGVYYLPSQVPPMVRNCSDYVVVKLYKYVWQSPYSWILSANLKECVTGWCKMWETPHLLVKFKFHWTGNFPI